MKKLLFLIPLLTLVGCHDSKEYRTPLEYCYLEVSTNYENYWEEDFDLPYSYKEIFTNYNLDSEWYSNHNVKSVYNYEITIYTQEKIDVWFCGIAFNCKYQVYLPSQCVEIDCDWIYSIEPESELKENNNE